MPPLPVPGAALRAALGFLQQWGSPRATGAGALGLHQSFCVLCFLLARRRKRRLGALWRQGQRPPLHSGWRHLGTSRGCAPALDARTQGLASILVVRCSVTAPPGGWAVLPVCGRRSQALRVQGRHARAWCSGPCRAHHLGARRPQPLARPKRIVVRVVFYEPGCVPRDRAAVEGFPWPGRRRRRARSGALPWPASDRCCSSCLGATQCNRRSLLRQVPGAQRLPHCCAMGPPLDTRSL